VDILSASIPFEQLLRQGVARRWRSWYFFRQPCSGM